MKNKIDKVSIILPYYKKKKFFAESLKSAINQTYPNKEIIVIFDDNDLSELDFVKNKISKHRNIKLINNNENFGASKSRNIGIALSNGKYIAFLDCDDLWSKNKLKLQIEFMKKKNISFSHTNYEIIDKDDCNIGKMIIKKKLSHKSLLKSCDIGLSTVIVEKNILPKNPFPPLKTKEDYVLWLKLSKNNEIDGLNKILTKWRKLENSLSSSVLQKIKDAFRVYFIYEKKSFFKSCFFTLRLIFFAIYKKLYLQKN